MGRGGFGQLGETVKNWGLFFVVFMAVGAGVVAANTYNDGAIGVDFQAYDSLTRRSPPRSRRVSSPRARPRGPRAVIERTRPSIVP